MTYLFLILIFFQANGESEKYRELESIPNWSVSRLKKFHKTYLKVLAYRSINQKYENKLIREDFSTNYFQNLDRYLKMFLIEDLIASSNEMYCTFAGWMSKLDKDKNCIPPWSRNIRADQDFKKFGPVYSKEFSCGKRNYIRCNPIVFGVEYTNSRGKCIKVKNEKDPNEIMLSCINEHEEDVDGYVKRLQKDPKLLVKYLANLAETLRYCKEHEGRVSYCAEFNSIISRVTDKVISCFKNKELYKYLPNLITPLNIEEMDTVSNNLGSSYYKAREDLELKQEKVMSQNRFLYDRAINDYSKSKGVDDAIKTINKKCSMCLGDSCNIIGNPKRKRCNKSVKRCLRYIKHALVETYGGSMVKAENYPHSAKYAVDSPRFLKKVGFINLMDLPEFSNLTPGTAPIGAVLVYKNAFTPNGRSGHIEIKMDENQYGSDHIKSKPINERIPSRKPIGIYVKIGDIKGIQEIPTELE